MSKRETKENWMNMNVDMEQPYAMQMAPLASALADFLRSSRKSFMCRHDFSRGWPEHTPVVDKVRPTITYTRSQVKDFVTQLFSIARNEGAKYASGVPDKPSQAAMIEWLGKEYVVTKGKNRNQRRILVLNAVAGVRKAHRIGVKQVKISLAIEAARANGDTVYTFGDKEYTSINKAAKAYCRDKFGSEWYTTDKAERLSKGIAHFTPAAGIEVVSTMSSAKVIGVAKKAGAPSDITTGKGAAARSEAWCLANADAVTPHLE